MKKLEIITLSVRYEEKLGWTCSATITNRIFGNTKSITGEISTDYFCDNIEEAVNNILECLNELGVVCWDNLDLVYYDVKQENPDECPSEVFDMFKKEREKIVSANFSYITR